MDESNNISIEDNSFKSSKKKLILIWVFLGIFIVLLYLFGTWILIPNDNSEDFGENTEGSINNLVGEYFFVHRYYKFRRS